MNTLPGPVRHKEAKERKGLSSVGEVAIGKHWLHLAQEVRTRQSCREASFSAAKDHTTPSIRGNAQLHRFFEGHYRARVHRDCFTGIQLFENNRPTGRQEGNAILGPGNLLPTATKSCAAARRTVGIIIATDVNIPKL